MKLKWFGSVLIGSLLLSACVEKDPLLQKSDAEWPAASSAARQKRPANLPETLKSVAAMQDRLSRVAAPLLLRNHESCKKFSHPLMGFTARNQYSFSPAYADEAAEALGLTEKLQIAKVMAGSGAARSGLHRGDVLVAIEDKPFPSGPTAEQEAPALLAPLLSSHNTLKLTVLRDRQPREFVIQPSPACAFRIELGNADNVNSYADGWRIMVTRGMLHFVQSDTELAYVIAKEMAHNALRHPGKLKSATATRDIINALRPVFPEPGSEKATADLPPIPREMDALADRLAINMLRRAGYNIKHAAAFWQRLADAYPASVETGHTALHPDTAYRLVAIEKTVAQIEARENVSRNAPAKSSSQRKKRRR